MCRKARDVVYSELGTVTHMHEQYYNQMSSLRTEASKPHIRLPSLEDLHEKDKFL